MNKINKLRELGEFLIEKKEYEKAYWVFSEIYDKFWNAIANINFAMNEFSRSYLNLTIKASFDFKKGFYPSALNSTFLGEFEMDIDQALNEYIFMTFGRLQSIIYSEKVIHEISANIIITDFLILYNLILKAGEENWVNILVKNYHPMISRGKLKTLLPSMKEQDAKKIIANYSEQISSHEWNIINTLLLDYLVITKQEKSNLFHSVKSNVQNYSFTYHKHYSRTSGNRKKNYSGYSRKERYERYEKEENFFFGNNNRKSEKDNPELMNEEYKAIYYGKLLGLKGKVTKTEIRKKYLKMISLYHPDKVAGMGKELRELAESKTKEINLAYEWLKNRYGL